MPRRIAFVAIIRGLGLLFYILWGFRLMGTESLGFRDLVPGRWI